MNTLRSRNYMKIKRVINSCENKAQLKVAYQMLENTKLPIQETSALCEIYDKKKAEFYFYNGVNNNGYDLEPAYLTESPESILHKRNCGAH